MSFRSSPSRENRARVAQETVEIQRNGFYYNSEHHRIDIGSWQRKAEQNTSLFIPSQLKQNPTPIFPEPCRVSVTLESTMHAVQRLANRNVVALNFASVRHPGGGFLKGSQAQEESIARTTGIYHTLLTQPAFYEAQRNIRAHNNYAHLFNSHHIIYSPSVPVFRDDQDQLLTEPYRASFITCAAVNAGEVYKRVPSAQYRAVSAEVETAMRQRIEYILSVAAHQKHEVVVLGAFGCGVFGNDSRTISRLFASVIQQSFRHRFREVVFAVLGEDTKKTFEQNLSSLISS